MVNGPYDNDASNFSTPAANGTIYQGVCGHTGDALFYFDFIKTACVSRRKMEDLAGHQLSWFMPLDRDDTCLHVVLEFMSLVSHLTRRFT